MVRPVYRANWDSSEVRKLAAQMLLLQGGGRVAAAWQSEFRCPFIVRREVRRRCDSLDLESLAIYYLDQNWLRRASSE